PINHPNRRFDTRIGRRRSPPHVLRALSAKLCTPLLITAPVKAGGMVFKKHCGGDRSRSPPLHPSESKEVNSALRHAFLCARLSCLDALSECHQASSADRPLAADESATWCYP